MSGLVRACLVFGAAIARFSGRRALAAASLVAEWRMLARVGHARITHLMGGDIQRMIAHRGESPRFCDPILTLAEGRLADDRPEIAAQPHGARA